MLQEVTSQNSGLLKALNSDFPYQHICTFSGKLGIALLSRHPLAGSPICSAHRAVLAVQIKLRDKQFWAVSAHIPWPWPFDTKKNEQAATDVFEQLTAPAKGSYRLMNIPLSIGHVLAPKGGSIRLRPLLGSDHVGILADLSVL